MSEPNASSGGAFSNDGVWSGALFIPSPNCDDRPAGEPVTLLVVHNISLPPGEFGGSGVVDLFLNRLEPQSHPYFAQITGLQVSSHFFIRRTGEVIQFVAANRRAWHAGQSRWRGRERCNDFSIGVELEGTDHEAFADAQYEALARLTRALRERYPIADAAGHCDISPGRKTDPGPHFDWHRYRHSIGGFV
ncbi:MAG: 1,6-anhydro-N-acetylmuramyl-L-alanine amidase AmpD [Betaproteobacteria bacterium]|nr:1,6-anhydro-N-acetylmuramyl-L-alanine amidase AmpD [Betaproteobacteria bacterium]